MSRCRHVPQDTTEAVEERRRTADDVLWCEMHAVTYLGAVVEDGTVAETGCFRHGCCAGCELDVYDFVWREVSRGQWASVFGMVMFGYDG